MEDMEVSVKPREELKWHIIPYSSILDKRHLHYSYTFKIVQLCVSEQDNGIHQKVQLVDKLQY